MSVIFWIAMVYLVILVGGCLIVARAFHHATCENGETADERARRFGLR